MIRFLLDTDILSLSERGDLNVRRRLTALSAEEIAVSLISDQEMMRGRLAVLSHGTQGERRVHAYQKLRATIRFLQSVQILDFDMDCEGKFVDLRKRKIRTGSQDLRIAATALIHGLTLVTRNTKDFAKIPGLPIEDWSV
jgi:tRNA(fMet)-specific endonuclease VapC